MKQNYLVVRACLVAVLIAGLFVPSYPVISYNGSGHGFCDGVSAMTMAACEEGEGASVLNKGAWDGLPSASGLLIENLVEEAGGAYIEGTAFFLKLLNRVEMANQEGVDYTEMLALAQKAQEKIAHSAAVYGALVSIANASVYNSVIQEKLRNFRYGEYAGDNGLNPVIFKEVESFLSGGDIRGIYNRTYTVVLEAEDQLLGVCGTLGDNKLPALKVLWETNEHLYGHLVFGQYVSRVFKEITGFRVVRRP